MNAGTYGVKAISTPASAAYNSAESAIVPFTINAVVLDRFSTAVTQDALNIAKAGTVSFAININALGIVDGQTVADLFNNVQLTLKMKHDSSGYELLTATGTAIVVNEFVYVSLKIDSALYNFLKQGCSSGETSASKADVETIELSALSNDSNYSLSSDALTRIFQSGKVVW